MRISNGLGDTDYIGVGAVIWSNWLFARHMSNYGPRPIPHGLKRGYSRVRPFDNLYTTYDGARFEKESSFGLTIKLSIEGIGDRTHNSFC